MLAIAYHPLQQREIWRRTFAEKRTVQNTKKALSCTKKIDMFTDSHPAVVDARSLFPGELRRFSSVILDLVFDYCLSRSWHQWQATNRSTFIESRLNSILQCSADLPKPASFGIRRMQENRLLHGYSELSGVEVSMRRIVARRPRFAPMLNAMTLLETKSEHIDATFQAFYPELLAHINQDNFAEKAESRCNSINHIQQH